MTTSPRWSDSSSRWVDHQRQMHYDHRLDYLPRFPVYDHTEPLVYPEAVPYTAPPTDEHLRRIVREEIADLLPIDVPDSLPE